MPEISEQVDRSDYRPREHKPAESSTFIRYFTVLASKINGDFSFDFTRTMISFFPIWIAEGKDQEEIHERYISATIFILSSLWPYVSDEITPFNKEYKEIDTAMNSCNIVEVSTKPYEDPTEKGDIQIMWGASTQHVSDNKEVQITPSTRTIFCKKEFYEQGIHCARENGYSRVNCGARSLFYRAMKLASNAGMLDPEKNTVKIAGPGVSQKQTDDFLSKSKKQLGA
jgi:hypothetical protein